MIETFLGIIVAVVIIILSVSLSAYFTTQLFAAGILIAIAFIYVGFSLKNNEPGSIVLESVIALGFYFLSIYGYVKNTYWIAVGIMLHGIWDICHHKGFLIATNIPGYWPSFCLTVDIIDGLYFLIVFRMQKKIINS